MRPDEPALRPNPPPLTVAWYPEEHPSDAPWARCSGWMQLGGTRHTVTCVVPCRSHLDQLATLLPRLTDELTECGYPWEVLLLYGGRSSADLDHLKRWCRLPGFQVAAFSGSVNRAVAALVGLAAARGEVVMIFEPDQAQAVDWISSAIERWQNGESFVSVAPTHVGGPLAFLPVPQQVELWPDVLSGARDFHSAPAGFVLLGRDLAAELLRPD